MGGEGLAAASVEDGEPGPAGAAVRRGEAERQRVEGADARQRHPEAGAEGAGAGDADPQSRERAGAEPDRDPLDRAPTAGRGGGALDLAEQPRRVARAAVGGEAEQRLVENLTVARRADGGVLGRCVEADQRQVSRGW